MAVLGRAARFLIVGSAVGWPSRPGSRLIWSEGGEDGGLQVIKTKRLRADGAARATSPPPWGSFASGALLAKAKRRSSYDEAEGARPPLARAELLDKPARARFEEEIDAALKRKPASELRLAGAVRAVAPFSPALRASLGEATAVLLRRGARQRELCACGLRALSEAQDRQAATLLRQALSGDEAGGAAALSAACFSRDQELSPVLAKIAASRQSHLAFGAELARVARGESNGALLAQLAPMIKESHRISMCIELFVPLVRTRPVVGDIGPALDVLRGAERHLGRWLVLAEVAVKAGDRAPLEESRARAAAGPSSSRSAWSLVAWALADTDAITRGAPVPQPPSTRPTLELIARLSDRPSADRDTTFLFRMARARSIAVRPMLEALARAVPLADETSIRAAMYLARDYGRGDLVESLAEAAFRGKREELRGMAAAALWDASSGNSFGTAERDRARDIADGLLASRLVGNVAWGALIRAASKGAVGLDPVLTETPFRWIQWGWLE
jgi:hypothetical protein